LGQLLHQTNAWQRNIAVCKSTLRYGTYHIVAGCSDGMFDWSSAAEDLGYSPQHNWPEIPQKGVS
jgi:hypothetical protein